MGRTKCASERDVTFAALLALQFVRNFGYGDRLGLIKLSVRTVNFLLPQARSSGRHGNGNAPTGARLKSTAHKSHKYAPYLVSRSAPRGLGVSSVRGDDTSASNGWRQRSL